MKILVVSRLFSAVRDAIQKDGDNAKGMPGFLKAMEYFSKHEVDIDYVFITTIPSDVSILHNRSMLSYIPESRIKSVIIKNARVNQYSGNWFLHRQLKRVVKRLLKENHYDFIYAMTPEATYANVLANRAKIPCGMRLYGTFLWSYLKRNGLLKTKIRFHDEIMAYNLPKSFLITTNDGSEGDKAYDKFCKDKSLYNFYYLLNGLDRITENPEVKAQKQAEISDDALLYVATLTRWKRQDRAIELVKLLKDSNVNCKLYFIGSCPPDCVSWKNELENKAKMLGVSDSIVYLGSLEREHFLYLAMKAKACLLFQDTTNMGNVFHELFSVGSVIVALNDGSLDDFITNGKNGFLVDNINEAAQVVTRILNNEYDVTSIRENAKKISEKMLKSWDDRFKIELELIRNAVKKQ